MDTATKTVIAVIISLVVGVVLIAAGNEYSKSNADNMKDKTQEMYTNIGK